MSGTRRVIVLAGAASAVLAAAACIDLFHGTGDLLDACQVDPTAPACGSVGVADAAPDVASDGYTNFCTFTSATAHEHAERTCAWLGACGSPSAHNQLGPCMVSAILAYDCNTNPDRQVLGPTRAFWQCMLGVASCSDVVRCLFPGGVEACEAGAALSSCGGLPGNGSTVKACNGGQLVAAENCAAWGQTCAEIGGAATCAGAAHARACDAGCAGTELVDCVGGVNQGVDCADYGQGACSTYLAAPACEPTGPHTDTATALVACVGDKAQSSPSGYTESVDCATLLGVTGTCHDGGSTSPVWDVSTACYAAGKSCGADACLDGGVAQSCARAVEFTADCVAAGLKPCTLEPVIESAGAYAACSPP
jgi:hypothetical protein